MEKITDSTKDRAIQVLINSFRGNPGVLRIIKQDEKLEQRLYEICFFSISIAMLKKGAFITSDQKGVGLFFNSNNRVPILPLLSAYMRLGSRCIGWDRAIPVFWKENIIKSKRLKHENIYFWMLGVEDNSNGLRTVLEIKDFAYEMADSLGLPIIAETRIEKNRRVYERYGFRCYATLESKLEEKDTWFLIRDPSID